MCDVFMSSLGFVAEANHCVTIRTFTLHHQVVPILLMVELKANGSGPGRVEDLRLEDLCGFCEVG